MLHSHQKDATARKGTGKKNNRKWWEPLQILHPISAVRFPPVLGYKQKREAYALPGQQPEGPGILTGMAHEPQQLPGDEQTEPHMLRLEEDSGSGSGPGSGASSSVAAASASSSLSPLASSPAASDGPS